MSIAYYSMVSRGSAVALRMPNSTVLPRRKMYTTRNHRQLRSRVAAEPCPNGALSVPQDDEHYMRLALEQAKLGASMGEVPVGAILVSNAQVISAAHNTTEATSSPLAHAELLCLQATATQLSSWRLPSCTLYVTLEPCPMCAGAILQSRIKRLVYGARQPRIGADGSWVSLFPIDDQMQQQQQTASSKCRGKAGVASFYNPDRAHARKAAKVKPHKAPGKPPACMLSASRGNDRHGASGSESWDAFVPCGVPFEPHAFHPNIQVTRGVLQEDCAAVLRDFFRRQPAN